MPAPAAPRKKGALTSSTATTRTSRRDVVDAGPSEAAAHSSAVLTTRKNVADELSTRLQRVAISSSSATAAPTKNSAAQRISAARTRPPPSHTPSSSSATAATKPLSADDALAAINKVLADLSTAHKAAASNAEASEAFQKQVKRDYVKAVPLLRLLRSAATSSQPEHFARQSSSISIERAASMLVAHCIEAGDYASAVEQLGYIKQSLTRLYASPASDNGSEDTLVTSLQNLQVSTSTARSSRTSSRVPFASSAGTSTRLNSRASSQRSSSSPMQELVALLSFPSFPEDWTSSHRLSDVCLSILVVQHQVLSCLFAVPISNSGTVSAATKRVSTSAKQEAPRTASPHEERCRLVLDALEQDAQGPLDTFRNCCKRVDQAERHKLEHYISTIYSVIMKKTDVIAAEADVDPEVLLRLRMHGLQCLLENTSHFAARTTEASESGSDKPVGTLFASIHRAIVAYGKSSTVRGCPEEDLAQRLESIILPLLEQAAIVITPLSRLARSKACNETLHLILQLYSRSDYNPKRMEATFPFLSNRPEVNSNTTSADGCVPLDYSIEVQRTCRVVASETCKLDKWIKSKYLDEMPPLDDLKTSFSAMASYVVSWRGADTCSSLEESDGKILSQALFILERLHFHAHRAYRAYVGSLEAQQPRNSPSTHSIAVSTVLESILILFGDQSAALKALPAFTAKLAPRVVDSMLLLARTHFRVDEPASYRMPFVWLRICDNLVKSLEDGKDRSSASRSVASAAYRLGHLLYANDKHANAIPFLSLCCAQSEFALHTAHRQYITGRTENARLQDSSSSDDYGHMIDKCVSRYETLAYCHAQCGEKTEALASYVAVVRLLSKPADWPSTQHTLARIVGKYTRMAILDMLMDPEAAKISIPAESGPHTLEVSRKEVIILLLQCDALHEHMHKPAAVAALKTWLTHAAQLSATTGQKLDLARILVWRLHVAASTDGEQSQDQLSALAAQVDEACASELESLRAQQYRAFARLHLAVYAVRSSAETASKILAVEAKKALTMLSSMRTALADQKQHATPRKNRTALPTSSPSSITKGATSEGVKGRKGPCTAPVLKRKPLSPKSPSTHSSNVNRTPPRPSKQQGQSPTSLASKSRSCLEDSSRNYPTLRIVAGLLSLFGHTFLSVAYLRILRNLHADHAHDHIMVEADLCREYLDIGKIESAKISMARAEEGRDTVLNDHTTVNYLLERANLLSQCQDHVQSEEVYSDASKVADRVLSSEGMQNSTSRVLQRTLQLYQAASAAEVYAQSQWRKGSPSMAFQKAMQALRLANRAITNLGRLTPTTTTTAVSEGLRSRRSGGPGALQTCPLFLDLGCRANQLLSRLLLWIADLLEVRGSVKTAAYFHRQALEHAESLKAPRLAARAVAKQAYLAYNTHDPAGAESDTVHKLTQLASQDGGLSALDVAQCKARLAVRNGDLEAAEAGYEVVLRSFTKLDKGLRDTEAQSATPVKPSSVKAVVLAVPHNPDVILPDMQFAAISEMIVTLYFVADIENAHSQIEKLRTYARTPHQQAYISALRARLHMLEGLQELSQDPIAGLLHESVLAVPLLVGNTDEENLAERSKTCSSLAEAEIQLLGALANFQSNSRSIDWRLAVQDLAALRILQVNMGRASALSAHEVAAALSSQTAVTCKREMLEILDAKITHGILADDLLWPGPGQARRTASRARTNYWTKLETRYSSCTKNGSLSAAGIQALLPRAWSVLSMHLSEDEQSVIAVRYERDMEPFILQLPIDRAARREGEESSSAYTSIMQRLAEIIEEANLTARNAKNVHTTEDRRAWWTQRKALDLALAQVLDEVDRKWLGCFRRCLAPSHMTPPRSEPFMHALEQALAKAIFTTRDNRSALLTLQPPLLRCFQSLPQPLEDDDIEDLLYFVVDSLQFAGVRIACDEIDVDQTVVDIRAVLEDHATQPDAETPSSDENHLFLVLDKGLGALPWESMPSFQGMSVSRLPSVDFLRDRLDLQADLPKEICSMQVPTLLADKAKVFYILNPGGDLKHTEQEFAEALTSRKFSGIRSRLPMEEEIQKGLSNSDIFLYFGHGGGEQFIRNRALHTLENCPTTLLFGCSSAALQRQGDYEDCGNPLVYMQAGAPAVIGNLWDVTDKDLDRLTHKALAKFGLLAEGSKEEGNSTLPKALADSRTACSLRYLNGASPVVWGVPVKLRV